MEESTKQPPEFSEDELRMPDNGFKTIEAEHHGKLGLILGLLIIALVLILAGLYLWFTNAFQTPAIETIAPTPVREVPDMPNDPETANADATVQQLETVSPASDFDSIEADVTATNLETLDAEMQAIDDELGVPDTESIAEPSSADAPTTQDESGQTSEGNPDSEAEDAVSSQEQMMQQLESLDNNEEIE